MKHALTFTPKVTFPQNRDDPAYWFIFYENRLLVQDLYQQAQIPLITSPVELALATTNHHYLGHLETADGPIHCYTAAVSEEVESPSGMAFYNLRHLFMRLDETMLALAGRAVQIIEWDRTHQYCGRCRSSVNQLTHERAKKCPNCGLTSYPRISPAMIVSVVRSTPEGKQLLLAQNAQRPSGFYSVLAGFVEPGESLEDCVAREIREEVGLEVKNIRYFGSQPWPFPHSLMIAFTAEYAAGEIVLEEEELRDAQWFSATNIPKVPPSVSIARQLIDTFIARNTT